MEPFTPTPLPIPQQVITCHSCQKTHLLSNCPSSKTCPTQEEWEETDEYIWFGDLVFKPDYFITHRCPDCNNIVETIFGNY